MIMEKIYNSIVNIFEKISLNIIYWLSIIFFAFVAVHSLCSTAFFKDWTYEKIYYRFDNIILNIILFFLGLFILSITNRIVQNKLLKKHANLTCEGFIFVYTIICGIIWILLAQNSPVHDAGILVGTTADIMEGNYGSLENGGWYATFSYMLGISWWFEKIFYIFGPRNHIAIYIFNTLFAAISNLLIIKISRKLYPCAKIQRVTTIMLAAFLPLIFFIVFAYGIIISIMFSLLALFYALKYLENKNIYHFIISFISITIAVLMKMNALIIGIAIIIMLLIETLKDKKRLFMLPLLCLYAFSMFGSQTLVGQYYSEKLKTGYSIGTNSIPFNAYFAMGLQEGGGYDFAPGWYNGLSYSIMGDNNNNPKEAKEKANEIIAERLRYFRENPGEAAEFFYYKTISQWNEPGYDAFSTAYQGVDNNIRSPFAKAIFADGLISTIIFKFQDIVHLMTFFGGTLMLILYFKKKSIRELIPALIVLGGFMFHTISEGKSQYIMQYGLISILLAAPGLVLLYEVADRYCFNKITKKKDSTEITDTV